jgi:hypothetical protein
MIKNLISLIAFLLLAVPSVAQLPNAVSPPINIANENTQFAGAPNWCSIAPLQCSPFTGLFRIRSNEGSGECQVGKYTTMSVIWDGTPPPITFFVVNLTLGTDTQDPPGQFHSAAGFMPGKSLLIGPPSAERLILFPTHQTLYPFATEYHASVLLPNDNAFVGFHLNFQYGEANSLLQLRLGAAKYARIFNS